MTAQTIDIPEWCETALSTDWRVWLVFGGRGSGKSHTVATLIACWMRQKPIRVLCLREFQNSIDDSSKQLLEDKIRRFGWADEFRITKYDIVHWRTGSRCTFRGMKSGNSLRSTEGVDIVWGEEAQTFSESSLRSLFPTIRKAGSRLIFTFNPEKSDDPIWVRKTRWEKEPRVLATLVNWRDNPWFTSELEEERQRDLRTDPDMYQHIWEGGFLRRSNALIFSGKCDFGLEFEAPPPWECRYYYGADFGFADDPATLTRSFIQDDCLWFDYAAFGYHVELEDMERLYDAVPGSREWPIKADSSRPDIISMMNNRGFRLIASEKGPGSVEDGITFMRSFRRIKVHRRCEELANEFMSYSYKVDPKTEQVLPLIVDKYNHGIDAARYSLEDLSKSLGMMALTDQELDELAYG